MAFYALTVTPLIYQLPETGSLKQVWYADDATGVGKLSSLRTWWDFVLSLGKHFGYYANALKTILVVKPSLLGEAERIFREPRSLSKLKAPGTLELLSQQIRFPRFLANQPSWRSTWLTRWKAGSGTCETSKKQQNLSRNLHTLYIRRCSRESGHTYSELVERSGPRC